MQEQETDPKQLILEAKAGNTQAFDALYNLYLVPVYRYIYLRIGDKQAAEDLSQVVFLKAYQNIRNFVDQHKNPLAYFFTIARNTLIDYYRKNRGTVAENSEEILLSMESSSQSPQELIMREESRKSVLERIKDLTPEQQEVIILKFINDLSYPEIAKQLNKSEEAVRQLQSRALKVLRAKLKPL